MKSHGGKKPALLVRFTPEQAAALEREAVADDRSMAYIVRKAVDFYLGGRRHEPNA